MDDDLKDFLDQDFVDNRELSPEEIFKLVTVLPERLMRVKAHLVDKDRQRIETAEIAQDLVNYIHEQMKKPENNAVNTQIFPLMAQLMVSFVSRSVGIDVAAVFFMAPAMKIALIEMAMAAFLFMQYVRQHQLKIVTEEEEITSQDLSLIRSREVEGQRKLDEIFRQLIGSSNDNGS